MSCQTNYDLRPYEIRKYEENLKTLYNYSLVLSLTPKIIISPELAKNSLKPEIEPFP